MMNFQPSPELLKQMLGGNSMPPMGPGGNTGFTGGMPGGIPMGAPQMSPIPMPHTGEPMPGQGIDVGMGVSQMPPMQHPMPPMGMPPSPMPMRKPPMGMKPPIKPKPAIKPMGNGGGMMQAYGQTKRAY